MLSKKALRDLKKVPKHIAINLHIWIETVKMEGLKKAQKITGYRDELLYGQRLGQRSIRLNRAYRAIYTIDKDGGVHFIEVLEVNKHDY